MYCLRMTVAGCASAPPAGPGHHGAENAAGLLEKEGPSSHHVWGDTLNAGGDCHQHQPVGDLFGAPPFWSPPPHHHHPSCRAGQHRRQYQQQPLDHAYRDHPTAVLAQRPPAADGNDVAGQLQQSAGQPSGGCLPMPPAAVGDGAATSCGPGTAVLPAG